MQDLHIERLKPGAYHGPARLEWVKTKWPLCRAPQG